MGIFFAIVNSDEKYYEVRGRKLDMHVKKV